MIVMEEIKEAIKTDFDSVNMACTDFQKLFPNYIVKVKEISEGSKTYKLVVMTNNPKLRSSFIEEKVQETYSIYCHCINFAENA